jgi:hypothetical protein
MSDAGFNFMGVLLRAICSSRRKKNHGFLSNQMAKKLNDFLNYFSK